MKLRVVIADDEPLARRRIRTLLADEADIEIAAESADGAEAVAAIAEYRPDILFLDVQMPRLSGFGVLEVLEPEAMPVVIFTTAHDEHALRAFEVHALDYLLKPFKESRFRQALDRARQQCSVRRTPQTDPQLNALMAHLRAVQGGPRILVRNPDRIFFVRADQIDHVESAGNYVVVHTGTERHVVRETMAAMEKKLVPAGFLRISRSHLVNLQRIRELQPVGASEYCVILKNGARLPMTCPLRELQQRMAQF